MPKKYQVFVSSTFRDLAEERQDAIKSILDLGHIPAGMELFPAADIEQLTYIKKIIDECDYYILIIGGRYGSIDESGVSFTEREYDYAVDTGKVILAFPHGEVSELSVSKSEISEELRESLERFRSKVMTGRLVREWTSREQLETLVLKALIKATSEFPRFGWIRGDAAASEELLQKINDMHDQIDKLKSENNLHNTKPIASIDQLATMAELFKIRVSWYDYKIRDIMQSYYSISWHEILKAVGPSLSVPVARDVLRTSLSKYLHENHLADSEISIFESDADLVQNQLEALGLLELTSQQSGTGTPIACLNLTSHGKIELMRALAVKSN